MTTEQVDFSDIDMQEDVWWVWHLQQLITAQQFAPVMHRFMDIGYELVLIEDSGDIYFQMLFHHPTEGTYLRILPNGAEKNPILALGTFEPPFLPPDTNAARVLADRFLEISKIVYEELHPRYGYMKNLDVFVEPEDVAQHKLTHLFWAQVFGPHFVEGMGRWLLTSAPAWRNENLVDGGLLYVVAMSPYLYQGPRQYWERAATYFAEHGVLPDYRADQFASKY